METDKGIQDPVVRALAEYISTPKFQRQFEQFFLDNALSFSDETEHQLSYMTIYIEFQHMFNEHMTRFLEEQGVTEDEFVAQCQKALKTDTKADQYLEIVLASMDYGAFYDLMKSMRARASVERHRAEAKDDDEVMRSSGKRKAPGASSKLSKDDDGDEDAAKGVGGEDKQVREGSKDSK